MDYEPSNYEELAATQVDSTKLFFLEDFIQSVKSDSVEIVFAISPRYKSVSRNMYIEIEKVCTKYDVPVLDFYNDSVMSIDKSLFEDAAHLNYQGASKYTSTLCTSLNSLLQRNN